MLNEARIAEIAREVAREKLTPKWFENVMVEPAVDSDGNDAVRITIIIAPSAVRRLRGEAILDTLVELRNRLDAEGEARFPIVEYATQEELAASGDPES
jgi:hypothetical protein